MEKKLSGKEVRYILLQNKVNLSWLSQQLGITPQTMQSRLSAREFKKGYLLEITNILERDIFGLEDADGNNLLNMHQAGRYLSILNNIDVRLKTVARQLNLSCADRITFYSARKSFVQHGFELGIPLEVLEYCIGQSMKVNRPIFNYVKIMSRHADEAIRKIVDNTKATLSVTD